MEQFQSVAKTSGLNVSLYVGLWSGVYPCTEWIPNNTHNSIINVNQLGVRHMLLQHLLLPIGEETTRRNSVGSKERWARMEETESYQMPNVRSIRCGNDKWLQCAFVLMIINREPKWELQKRKDIGTKGHASSRDSLYRDCFSDNRFWLSEKYSL